MMDTIYWGIIGCGDVAEIKSGPAFQKVNHSRLISVMRRDAGKAADYARRHGVPHWTTDADELLHNPDVNAIYIATPPDTHIEYALKALRAGKFVYLEKPMSVNLSEAIQLELYVSVHEGKVVIAHYRRQQAYFLKIKELLSSLGEIRTITLSYKRKCLTVKDLESSKLAWRVNPDISGGGLFYDIAPHQLDLLCHWFGEPESAQGTARCTNSIYGAPDTVRGEMVFRGGTSFSGFWNFNANPSEEEDICLINGSKGILKFPFFDKHPILLETELGKQEFSFQKCAHVQQPMIERVVAYFLGHAPNPCTVREGRIVMEIMEKMSFTIKN